MRETIMALSPVAVAIYFVLFPAQFTYVLVWLVHMVK